MDVAVGLTVGLALVAMMTISGCYLSHERPRDAAPRDAVRSDASADCSAMLIGGPPGCTIGGRAWWWWDGSTCSASDCPCSGADCDRTFTSAGACLAAFDGCDARAP